MSVLLLLLTLACITDARERRIPNLLVLVALASGFIASSISDPGVPGLLRALGGVVVAFAIWFPGWLFRMIGAGDVKLFAAVGAWLGPMGTVNASIAAALLGGILALAWMLFRRGRASTRERLWVAVLAPKTLMSTRSDPAAGRDLVPYSLAIAAGVLVQLAFPGWVVG